MLRAVVVLALALCATAGAQRTFTAVTEAGAAGAAAAEGSLWLDAATGEAEWAVNVTGLAPGAAVTLAIVDGHPDTKLDTVVVLGNATADAEGGVDAAGAFGPSDLTAAYASMSFEELAGHMGMGHIFLEAAAPEGKLYGAWAEAGAPAVPAVTAAAGADDHAHDMADGHDHGAEGAAADKQAAGAMAMPMPAADDHAHSEGDGHVHRRRLLFA